MPVTDVVFNAWAYRTYTSIESSKVLNDRCGNLYNVTIDPEL